MCVYLLVADFPLRLSQLLAHISHHQPSPTPTELGMMTGMEVYGVGVGSGVDDLATVSAVGVGGRTASDNSRLPAGFSFALEAARAAMTDCVAAVRASGVPLPSLRHVELEYVRDVGEGGFGAVKLYNYFGRPLALKVNTHAAEVQGFVEEAVVLA